LVFLKGLKCTTIYVVGSGKRLFINKKIDFMLKMSVTRALSQNVTNAPEGALTPNLKNVKVTVQNKLHFCRKFSGQNSSMKINKEQ